MISRTHGLALSVLLGAASAVGAYALIVTAGLGDAQTKPEVVSGRQIAERARKLDAWEASLRKTLKARPPALPALNRYAAVTFVVAPGTRVAAGAGSRSPSGREAGDDELDAREAGREGRLQRYPGSGSRSSRLRSTMTTRLRVPYPSPRPGPAPLTRPRHRRRPSSQPSSPRHRLRRRCLRRRRRCRSNSSAGCSCELRRTRASRSSRRPSGSARRSRTPRRGRDDKPPRAPLHRCRHDHHLLPPLGYDRRPSVGDDHAGHAAGRTARRTRPARKATAAACLHGEAHRRPPLGGLRAPGGAARVAELGRTAASPAAAGSIAGGRSSERSSRGCADRAGPRVRGECRRLGESAIPGRRLDLRGSNIGRRAQPSADSRDDGAGRRSGLGGAPRW